MYLKGTASHGLLLKKNSSLNFVAYSDVDWGGDLDQRNSTIGYVLYLGLNPISWKSMACSSIEAEYNVIANTKAEILWFKNLLSELRVNLLNIPTLLYDNIGATYLSANMSARMPFRFGLCLLVIS